MAERGKLDVNVRRRKPNGRNSFGSGQNSFENEFINSNYTSNISSNNNQSNNFKGKNRQEEQESHHNDRYNQISQEENELEDNSQEYVDRNRRKPEKVREQSIDLAKSKTKAEKSESPAKKQKTLEEKKIKSLNKNMSKLNESINQMKDGVEELEREEKVIKKKETPKNSPFKVNESIRVQDSQVLSFLREKKEEKRQRELLKKKAAWLEERKRQRNQIESQLKKEQEKKKKISEIKKNHHFKERKEERKKYDEEHSNVVKQFYKKYEGYERYHVRKEQEDHIKKAEIQEEERRIIAERKEILKPMKSEDIQVHQKWHDEKLEEILDKKRKDREEFMVKISEQNNRFHDLWKGNGHSVEEQERAERLKKKKQPWDKQKKIKQYREYVRQNFVPKTLQNKSADKADLSSSRLSAKEVKRYRFYKGVAYGEISELKPMPKSQKQARKIGDDYLNYMHSLPKKKKRQNDQSFQLDPEDIEILNKKFNSVVKIKKEFHPLYDHTKKKKNTMEISKDPQREELKMFMSQLKSNDEKIKQKQKLLNYQSLGRVENLTVEQKEINQSLINNIEKKLSLLTQL